MFPTPATREHDLTRGGYRALRHLHPLLPLYFSSGAGVGEEGGSKPAPALGTSITLAIFLTTAEVLDGIYLLRGVASIHRAI